MSRTDHKKKKAKSKKAPEDKQVREYKIKKAELRVEREEE